MLSNRPFQDKSNYEGLSEENAKIADLMTHNFQAIHHLLCLGALLTADTESHALSACTESQTLIKRGV